MQLSIHTNTLAQPCSISGPGTVDVLTNYNYTATVSLPQNHTVLKYIWTCNYISTSGSLGGQSGASTFIQETSASSHTITIKWGTEFAPINLEYIECTVQYKDEDNQLVLQTSCTKQYKLRGIPSLVHLSGPASIQKCCSTAVTYTVVDYGDGNIFNWSIPGGWTILSGGTTGSNTVTLKPDYTSGGTVNCNVQISTAPASYSRNASKNITRTEPEMAFSSSKPDPCDGQQITFTAITPCGIKDFSWSVPGGWTVVNQNFNSITVLVKESGAVTVNSEFFGDCVASSSAWISVISTPPPVPKYKKQCPDEDPDGCPLGSEPRFCVWNSWGGSIYILDEEDDDSESYNVVISAPWVLKYQGNTYSSITVDDSEVNDITIHLPNWNSTNLNVLNGQYRIKAINCVGESDLVNIPFKGELDWWCECPNYLECVCPPLFEHPGYPCGRGPFRIEESLGIKTNQAGVVLFPNPATNQLNIESTELIESIEVYDLIGKMIMQQSLLHNQTVLNLNISEGLYLVKVKQKNAGASIHKISVTK